MTAIPCAPGKPKRYVVSSVRAAGPTPQASPDADPTLGVASCDMRSLSRFVLNKHGRVFHLPGCDIAGKAQPWAWVEPLTNSQIHQWIEPLGVRPCRKCDPLENK